MFRVLSRPILVIALAVDRRAHRLIRVGANAAGGQPGRRAAADARKRARAGARQQPECSWRRRPRRGSPTEDRVQARAGLLPSLSGFGQYIYTQPNGTPSGVFVANDGPNVYNAWGTVHGECSRPASGRTTASAAAAEAVARARADVAARGLVATIVQNYYTLVAAQRKATSAQQGLTEAEQFLDITERQERGGEVAHSDVVKAQIQVAQRRRDAQDAELTAAQEPPRRCRCSCFPTSATTSPSSTISSTRRRCRRSRTSEASGATTAPT